VIYFRLCRAVMAAAVYLHALRAALRWRWRCLARRAEAGLTTVEIALLTAVALGLATALAAAITTVVNHNVARIK
jgi:predicted MarR family transcription regulator